MYSFAEVVIEVDSAQFDALHCPAKGANPKYIPYRRRSLLTCMLCTIVVLFIRCCILRHSFICIPHTRTAKRI